MAKHKINQYITINGVKRWITADTMQEFAEKVIKLSGTAPEPQKHPFDEYAWNWFNTYSKPTVATVTATTYGRPRFLRVGRRGHRPGRGATPFQQHERGQNHQGQSPDGTKSNSGRRRGR